MTNERRNKLIKLFHTGWVGTDTRRYLAEMLSPDISKNSEILDKMIRSIQYSYIPNNECNIYCSCIMEFLWENVPNLLSYFDRLVQWMFLECDWLPEKLVIPANVKEIQTAALARCNIKELQIEGPLEKIYDSAFDDLKLTELDLSNTVITTFPDTSIDYLGTLYLPGSMSLIKDYALSCVYKVCFPNVNSIKDLNLTISDLAVSNIRDRSQKEIIVETRTDSSKILVGDNFAELKLDPTWPESGCKIVDHRILTKKTP